MSTRRLPGQDWTESERAEIRRLQKLCDASKHWTLECSQTDIGDPWCIVYDQAHHRIILHITSIEKDYVVVWPREQRSEKTAIIALAIEMALEGLKSYRQRAGCLNVYSKSSACCRWPYRGSLPDASLCARLTCALPFPRR